MPFNPTMLTSIHGLRLGLNSTGAIITNVLGTMLAAVMQSSAGVIQGIAQSGVASSLGSTLTNYGLQAISSGSATAVTMEIAAPVAGVRKEILIGTSASEFTLGGTATDVIFKPAIAGAGSSMFLSAVNLAGTNIILRGVSATQWSVIGSTTTMTIG